MPHTHNLLPASVSSKLCQRSDVELRGAERRAADGPWTLPDPLPPRRRQSSEHGRAVHPLCQHPQYIRAVYNDPRYKWGAGTCAYYLLEGKLIEMFTYPTDNIPC